MTLQSNEGVQSNKFYMSKNSFNLAKGKTNEVQVHHTDPLCKILHKFGGEVVEITNDKEIVEKSKCCKRCAGEKITRASRTPKEVEINGVKYIRADLVTDKVVGLVMMANGKEYKLIE